MSDTQRTRDPVRTRHRILEAAAVVVLAHGASASLELVAREAGVSKGGLLHHFRSKDDLLVALAAHLTQTFEEQVEAQLDPDDAAPGRLVRAYVRASLHQLEAAAVRDEATLMAALSTVPHVVRDAQSSNRRWRERFAADGLDAGRAGVIIRAADGATAAALFEGHLDQGEIDQLRDELIALTYDPGPFAGRPATAWR